MRLSWILNGRSTGGRVGVEAWRRAIRESSRVSISGEVVTGGRRSTGGRRGGSMAVGFGGGAEFAKMVQLRGQGSQVW